MTASPDFKPVSAPAAAAAPGRRLYSWLLAVAVLLAVEILSFLALSATQEGWASWARLAERRAAVLDEAVLGETLSDQPAAAEQAPEPSADGADFDDDALDSPGADFDDDAFRRLLPRRHREEQVLHPFLGFVLDPTRHPAAHRPGADAQSGSLGFVFNSEPLVEPRDGDDRLRVVVLGGSVANALANGGRPALAEALARVPRFAGREVVILSAANPGYKQPQQLFTLAYLLALGADYDLVLNLDGFNEVALPPVELVPRGVFPHFPQNWPLRVGDLDPGLQALLGEVSYLRRQRQRLAQSYSNAFCAHSFTCGLLWSALDGRAAARVTEAGARFADLGTTADLDTSGGEPAPGSRPLRVPLGFQETGPDRTLLTDAPLTEDLVAVWHRSSVLLAELCAARGIEYHHFLQPNQYDDGAKPLSPEEKRTAWRADHPYRQPVLAGYPALRAAGAGLRADGIAFTDLSRLFATTEETLYLDDCCHLNRRGNELLAAAIGRALGGEAP